MNWENIKAHLRGAWRSRTIRFNALAALVLMKLDLLSALLPQLQPYLKPDSYQNIMLGVVVTNLVLRFLTSKSLAEK